MIGWLLVLGLVVLGAICVFALGGRLRGRRFVVIPPGKNAKPEPMHRQAINHFSSGVLPPWR
jgi:hypothetical protein